MKTVKVYEIRGWRWVCQKYGQSHTELLNPALKETVVCKQCGAEFIPEGSW